MVNILSPWHLDFIWGLKGIERYIADHGYTFKDHDGGQYEHVKTSVFALPSHFQVKIIIF